ncbi:MAG: hypothetical protein KBD51_00070 [Candidatus Levybacteria bacterium]|nr:hypothetical protein [Candidatus Levybacteria bacterium]
MTTRIEITESEQHGNEFIRSTKTVLSLPTQSGEHDTPFGKVTLDTGGLNDLPKPSLVISSELVGGSVQVGLFRFGSIGEFVEPRPGSDWRRVEAHVSEIEGEFTGRDSEFKATEVFPRAKPNPTTPRWSLAGRDEW